MTTTMTGGGASWLEGPAPAMLATMPEQGCHQHSASGSDRVCGPGLTFVGLATSCASTKGAVRKGNMKPGLILFDIPSSLLFGFPT